MRMDKNLENYWVVRPVQLSCIRGLHTLHIRTLQRRYSLMRQHFNKDRHKPLTLLDVCIFMGGNPAVFISAVNVEEFNRLA